MAHSTRNTPPFLQSLLFSHDDLGSCLFREPSGRELEFLQYYHGGVKSLLTCDELHRLRRSHCRGGRLGYDLLPILGIMLLKLHHQVKTVKGTLSLLCENGNLKDMLAITKVPSEATVSLFCMTVMSSIIGEIPRGGAVAVEEIESPKRRLSLQKV